MLLLLMSVFFLFNGHQKLLFADSVDAFKQKDIKSQVEFINSMSKQEKFRFLKEFLPGSCFYAPPNTFMIFLRDGRVLNKSREYFYTRWSVINNTFKLWKENSSDSFPEFTSMNVMTDLIAEYVITGLIAGDGRRYDDPSLWLRFSNSKDEADSLQYKSGCAVFWEGNPSYEQYKRSLTPQELARLEELNPPIKPSAIVDDKQPDMSNYTGIYDFGVAEPWDLVIFIVDGKAYMQSMRAQFFWNEHKVLWECHNFEEVEIRENELMAKIVSGRFVIATIEGENKKGLLLHWKHDGKEELGKKYNMSIQRHVRGKYPETYFKRLDERDLANKTKQDLKIMRNEIYARYGHKFVPNGTMDQYFSSQTWYQPRDIDANNCLTEIEKENVKLIQARE